MKTLDKYFGRLSFAVEWGYLEEARMSKFRFCPEMDNLKERRLTQEEEQRLLSALAGPVSGQTF